MALLSTASVGRIGVNVDALPTVLPVNFALFDGAVVFRTAPGTKLHLATRDAVVAFQADHYSNMRDPAGWSVLIRGVAQTITDPSVLRAAQHLPLLGDHCNWVQNARANNGRVVVRRGSRRCQLVEIPADQRPPIIKRYLQKVPGGRPHVPVDRDAPVADFAAIADQYPVFRVDPRSNT